MEFSPLEVKLLDLSVTPNISSSLKGNELLLATLEEVSKQVLDRAVRASESVRELSLEATATQVTLQNTVTRVALLANTKFIESVRAFFFIPRVGTSFATPISHLLFSSAPEPFFF